MSATEDAPPLIHALAGAVASIFSNTAVYPLDLITTRIQTQQKEEPASKSGSQKQEYDNVLDALLKVYREEGLSALYRGVGADNFSTMLSTFCYHYAYQNIREARLAVHARANGGNRPRVLGIVEELTIGAGAGVISRFVTSPASNIVTRAQTQSGSTRDIIKSIYEEKGLTGFFSGMKASVLLAINPSVAYYLFELQKALLIPRSRRDKPRAIEIFLMSAIGKAFATLLLYPVILIKARTQATHAKTSLIAMVKSIVDRHGLAGLYSGAAPQVAKGFLSQGIMMLLKDKITTFIVASYIVARRSLSLTRGTATREALSPEQARERGLESIPSVLALPSQPDRSASFYYSDTPRQDVNGLILATKDAVEQAVDRAVDRVGEVASEVKHGVERGIKTVTDAMSNTAKEVPEAGDRALAAVCNAIEEGEKSMALAPGSHSTSVGEAAKQAAAQRVPTGLEWSGQTRVRNATQKVTTAGDSIKGIHWASQQKKAASS
ncbi:hypothetical protein PYCC9005_000537 [Savitreella phatthalungensis]